MDANFEGGSPAALHKSGKSDLFLCGLCVSMRPSALKRPINAENTEIRRGPQRKDFHPNSIFVQSHQAHKFIDMAMFGSLDFF